MTHQEFDALLDAFDGNAEHDLALIANSPVSTIGQLQTLLDQCDTEAEALTVVAANAAIAEQMAVSTNAYLQLIDAGKSERPEVEALLAAIKCAPDRATVAALFASAESDTFARAASQLALYRMSPEDLQKSYFALLEVGK